MDAGADAQKQRFRKFAPELGLLLWAIWPIGAWVPIDEYDAYVPTYLGSFWTSTLASRLWPATDAN